MTTNELTSNDQPHSLNLYIKTAARLCRDAHFFATQVTAFDLARHLTNLLDLQELGLSAVEAKDHCEADDVETSRSELLEAMSICLNSIDGIAAIDDMTSLTAFERGPHAAMLSDSVNACYELMFAMLAMRNKMLVLHTDYQIPLSRESLDERMTRRETAATGLLCGLVRLRDACRGVVTPQIEAHLLIEGAMRSARESCTH